MDDIRYDRNEDDPRIDEAVDRVDRRLRGKVANPLLRAGVWLAAVVALLVVLWLLGVVLNK